MPTIIEHFSKSINRIYLSSASYHNFNMRDERKKMLPEEQAGAFCHSVAHAIFLANDRSQMFKPQFHFYQHKLRGQMRITGNS